MSATGRSPVRRAGDFYATPPWCVEAIAHMLPRTGVILDPFAGDGAILRELQRIGRGAGWGGCELDTKRAETARGDGFDVWIGDAFGAPWWSLVVTNPPYSRAFDAARYAAEQCAKHGTEAWLLLRLAMLEGQRRAPWLREHAPDVYVLPKRPSFTGRGTDATAYAWMRWGPVPQRVGRVSIL